jgi:hypothetical protein
MVGDYPDIRSGSLQVTTPIRSKIANYVVERILWLSST